MCSALVVVYNSFLPLSAKVFSTKCLPMSIGETFLLRSFPLCSTFIQAVDVHCCSPAYYINLAHIPMHVINVPEHRQWNNFLRSVAIKAKVDTSKAELDKLQKTNLALQSDISQVFILWLQLDTINRTFV